MRPHFSVIIPTLNEELFLPKILTDLTRQQYKNFEVIIVDGHSKDGTKKEAYRFKNSYALKFIDGKKRSLSYQRNLGAEKAKGDFLVFLDADVRVRTSFTNQLLRQTEKYKYLIYIPFLYPQQGSGGDKVLFKLMNAAVEMSQNLAVPIPSSGAMIFQKDFFKHIGGYREDKGHTNNTLFPEDHELILRASKAGVRAKFMRSVTVGYSLRRMNTEGKFNTVKKYLLSSVEMTLKGKLDKKLAHEMGGHLYALKTHPRKKTNL